MNEHFLRADKIEQYGQEQKGLADKTWPLVAPQGMRLAAIVTSEPFGNHSFDVGFDITAPERYERLIQQVWAGKWSDIRLFFLSDLYLEKCRLRRNT